MGSRVKVKEEQGESKGGTGWERGGGRVAANEAWERAWEESKAVEESRSQEGIVSSERNKETQVRVPFSIEEWWSSENLGVDGGKEQGERDGDQ